MVFTHDLKGQKFGKLLVIERVGSRKYECKNHAVVMYSLWKCICDCGQLCEIVSNSLVGGKSRSCGCSRRKTKYLEGKAFGKIFRSYTANAKRRGILFELSYDKFLELITSPCYYTGRQPSRLSLSGGHHFVYNGIDRLNNELGYTVENSVPCCFEANRMKSDMNENDFLNLIKEIGKYKKLF